MTYTLFLSVKIETVFVAVLFVVVTYFEFNELRVDE
jgi:hypothetical protein